jgi:4-alpha-glucanotransferase
MNPTTSAKAEIPLFNWLSQRGAGVLLHPSCLPGSQGIGTFELIHIEAFLNFITASGMRYWQVCPMGPTGYGDSPYQCFSAFAGNPYLIDLNVLVHAGLLDEEDLDTLKKLPSDHVDFGALWENKWALLFKAHSHFVKREGAELGYGDFAQFQTRNAKWLAPYSLFSALKDHFKGAPWWEWPETVRSYEKARKETLVLKLGERIQAHAFFQYLFFGQWTQVRKLATARGIEIIGDIPIFVARDSADVWANPRLFEVDAITGAPLAVAGVPPDYFSEDGQLWGNPLYRWEAHAADGYAWWLSRLESAFALADVVRIDHFRGFDEYWRIPANALTARTGEWTAGPGLDFFRAVQARMPEAKIIAEDLGEIGPSVLRLREASGLPGMVVLQFAFGGSSKNLYLPHNQQPNSVVYPGTHDNNTSIGWYETVDEKTKDHVRRYLRVPGSEIGWDLLRSAYASVCRLAITPMQDLLSLGSQARLNTPGTAQGNWQWRFSARDLDRMSGGTTRYLHGLSVLYGRSPDPEDAEEPEKKQSGK